MTKLHLDRIPAITYGPPTHCQNNTCVKKLGMKRYVDQINGRTFTLCSQECVGIVRRRMASHAPLTGRTVAWKV